ncbi:MAG: hypothetical protein JXB23_13945, partial [Candidatus Aminicenantes bacterium]|nr:hypothetical protein [Candidatus Aminicenantes bacterium]
DVQKKASLIIGPTHLASRKWLGFNYAGGGLALFLLIGTAVFASFRARKNILIKCREWLKSMEREEKTEEVKESLEIKAEEKEPVASEDKQE